MSFVLLDVEMCPKVLASKFISSSSPSQFLGTQPGFDFWSRHDEASDMAATSCCGSGGQSALVFSRFPSPPLLSSSRGGFWQCGEVSLCILTRGTPGQDHSSPAG